MILETIFLWTGGLLIICLILVGLMWCWFRLYQHYFFDVIISVKALHWHFCYEFLKARGKNPSEIAKLKIGAKWYTQLRDKEYQWELINIKEYKK